MGLSLSAVQCMCERAAQSETRKILLLLIADWQTVRFISKQIEAVDIGW